MFFCLSFPKKTVHFLYCKILHDKFLKDCEYMSIVKIFFNFLKYKIFFKGVKKVKTFFIQNLFQVFEVSKQIWFTNKIHMCQQNRLLIYYRHRWEDRRNHGKNDMIYYKKKNVIRSGETGATSHWSEGG